jgi:hypothetical protein
MLSTRVVDKCVHHGLLRIAGRDRPATAETKNLAGATHRTRICDGPKSMSAFITHHVHGDALLDHLGFGYRITPHRAMGSRRWLSAWIVPASLLLCNTLRGWT